MAGIVTLAPIGRNKSNLGGVIYIDVFDEADTLATNFDYPGTTEITAGEIPAGSLVTAVTGMFPSGVARRLKFDIETLHIDFESSGDSENQSYTHTMEGVVSGYDKTHVSFMNSINNRPVIVIGTMPNGDRIMAGSKLKPMVLNISGSTGTKGSDKKSWKLTGKMQGSCGFAPLPLNTATTYTTN
jgi:hypothetical protein